jgi:hypothetical protein
MKDDNLIKVRIGEKSPISQHSVRKEHTICYRVDELLPKVVATFVLVGWRFLVAVGYKVLFLMGQLR